MNNLSTQPYKGARDFYPEDMRMQKFIFNTWRAVCERYGYEEYTAPILEPLELYLAKSGQEIVNEQTYNFEDRGGRQVTLRPEMTPTVSRMVAARRQELSYPLRLYSIPNLWRYERPQRGRLREHWQLNVDVFGIEGLEAEIELISLAHDIMAGFGAKPSMYEIRINSRLLTNKIMSEYLELDTAGQALMIKLLDRFHKLPADEFEQQAIDIFENEEKGRVGVTRLTDLLKVKTLDQLPASLANTPEAKSLVELLRRLESHGVANACFDVSLMRGFDYYTDVVFEVYDTNPENSRSMFGGGRFDGLVGLFGVAPVPTVGFGMGDVVIGDFLQTHGLLPKLPTETEAYIAVIGDYVEAAEKLAGTLREEGVCVAVDYSRRAIDKQIRSALNKQIPYVIFVGEKEATANRFNIKHLATGQEEEHGPERIVATILDQRKK